MGRRILFPLFLLAGVCASGSAIGLQATGATASPPMLESSTATEAAPNVSPTVVTEPTPEATPSYTTDTSGVPAASPTAVATIPLATPTVAPVESPVSTFPVMLSQPDSLDSDPAYAQSLLLKMNAARNGVDVDALALDEDLDGVALERALDLIENGYFDHYSPSGDSAFAEMGSRGIRYGLAGENLARNTYPDGKTVDAAYEGLMGSPGHRANILEPRFARVGIAAVKSGKTWYYVTVFTD